MWGFGGIRYEDEGMKEWKDGRRGEGLGLGLGGIC